MNKYLIMLAIKQTRRFWQDQWKIIKKHYRNKRFISSWLWLRGCYFLDSPYWVSRRFQRKSQLTDLHVYGETPLLTLELIMNRVNLTACDHIFELGAGSGFTSVWLNTVNGCHVTAIEQVPVFCWRLQRTARRFGLSGIEVRCADYLATSMEGASIIYLYGSNLERPVIEQLTERLAMLPDQVRVISISYPLSDYSKKTPFPLIDQFTAGFEWGEANVFVQSIR